MPGTHLCGVPAGAIAGGRQRRTVRALDRLNNFLIFPLLGMLLIFSIQYRVFSALTYLVIFLALFFGLVFVIRVIFFPARLRKLFGQYTRLTGVHEITIRDDTYSERSQYGQAAIPWNKFVKWTQDDRLILIFQTDLQFFLLPKRLLSEEQVLGISNVLTHAGIQEITPSVPRIALQALQTAVLVSVNLSLGLLLVLNFLLGVLD